VSERHSRQVAPGIWFGLSRADASNHCVNGWMWVTPGHRTIWIRNQQTHEPVVFYDDQDGNRRELIITHVAGDSVSGRLLLYGRGSATRPPSTLNQASN
jgi:hypothetical protein